MGFYSQKYNEEIMASDFMTSDGTPFVVDNMLISTVNNSCIVQTVYSIQEEDGVTFLSPTNLTQTLYEENLLSSSNLYFVDGANGIIKFSSNLKGVQVKFTYKATGEKAITSSRVIMTIDSNGDIKETLTDYVNKIQDFIKTATTVSDLQNILMSCNTTIDNMDVMQDSSNRIIVLANNTDVTLNNTINNAEETDIILNNTINNAEDKDDELNITIVDANNKNETLLITTNNATTKDNNLKNTIATANVTNSTLNTTNTTALETNDTLKTTNIIALETNDTLKTTNIIALETNDTLSNTTTNANTINTILNNTNTTALSTNETLANNLEKCTFSFNDATNISTEERPNKVIEYTIKTTLTNADKTIALPSTLNKVLFVNLQLIGTGTSTLVSYTTSNVVVKCSNTAETECLIFVKGIKA